MPPHSSREYEPSPISTIRTTSPYFSPNSAIAPRRLASSSVVVIGRTGSLRRIHSLTRSSIARAVLGRQALGVGEVEAQLVRARRRSRPGGRASPRRSRSAACSRCVAVWLAAVAWRVDAVDARDDALAGLAARPRPASTTTAWSSPARTTSATRDAAVAVLALDRARVGDLAAARRVERRLGELDERAPVALEHAGDRRVLLEVLVAGELASARSRPRARRRPPPPTRTFAPRRRARALLVHEARRTRRRRRTGRRARRRARA